MILQKILPPLGFTLFFLAIDWYAFQSFKQLIPYSGLVRKWLNAGYWSVSGILLITMFFIRIFGLPGNNRILMVFCLSIFFIFFISKFILCFFLLIEDAYRGISFVIRTASKYFFSGTARHSPGRSAALAKIAAGIAAVPLVSLVYGMVKGAYKYKVHRLDLVLKNLPAAFQGLKIVQISDVHVGSFYDKEAVLRGVNLLMDEKPDIVFFTGDLVNNEAAEFDSYKEIFGLIKAPMGVYSILGNHDYGDYKYWESEDAKRKNLENLKDHHSSIGWRLLMDEHIYLKKGGSKIAIAGVQNWGAKGNFPKYGNLKKALKGIDEEAVLLLLSHDPSHWEAQVVPSFPQVLATFSGHTHGMQFGIEIPGLKWSPVQYFYKQWAGLYEKNGQQLYVNRGFGFLGYPGRVGIWPEITSFTLKSS